MPLQAFYHPREPLLLSSPILTDLRHRVRVPPFLCWLISTSLLSADLLHTVFCCASSQQKCILFGDKNTMTTSGPQPIYTCFSFGDRRLVTKRSEEAARSRDHRGDCRYAPHAWFISHSSTMSAASSLPTFGSLSSHHQKYLVEEDILVVRGTRYKATRDASHIIPRALVPFLPCGSQDSPQWYP